MSVMLFTSSGIYKTMAESYEGLKRFTTSHTCRIFTQDDDRRFYNALRRLYFANLVCHLCDCPDDIPFPSGVQEEIRMFSQAATYKSSGAVTEVLVDNFLGAWTRLKEELHTNDGELYKAVDSYEYMEELAGCYGRALAESLCILEVF